MTEYNIFRGRALRIAVGIAMLVLLLVDGTSAAAPITPIYISLCTPGVFSSFSGDFEKPLTLIVRN